MSHGYHLINETLGVSYNHALISTVSGKFEAKLNHHFAGKEARHIIGQSQSFFCLNEPRVKIQQPRLINKNSYILSLQKKFRDTFRISTSAFSEPYRGLVSALFLGDTSLFNKQLKKAFKNTGCIHLIVVSGLHIHFLSSLVLFCLLVPGKLAYGACLIGPKWWLNYWIMTRFISVCLIWFYGVLINFPPSAQRAVLVFTFAQIYHGQPRDKSNMVDPMSLLTQILIFPIGIFQVGNLLSWLAYLTVKHAGKGVKGFLWSQSILSVISAFFFGKLSILAFVTNFLLTPIFPFFFSLLLAASLIGINFLTFLNFTEHLCQIMLAFIAQLDLLAMKHPALLVPIDQDFTKWGVFICFGMTLLNLSLKVTKSRSGLQCDKAEPNVN